MSQEAAAPTPGGQLVGGTGNDQAASAAGGPLGAPANPQTAPRAVISAKARAKASAPGPSRSDPVNVMMDSLICIKCAEATTREGSQPTGGRNPFRRCCIRMNSYGFLRLLWNPMGSYGLQAILGQAQANIVTHGEHGLSCAYNAVS